MYNPSTFEQTDTGVMHDLIEAHPFGAWVIGSDDGLEVNHLPFHLDRERGLLLGHVAKANPVWKLLEGGRAGVAVFQGPQRYITPSWYPGKREHGKVVPTWNYAVVHAHGVARAVQDADWLEALVNRLTDARERHEAAPWAVSDAPDDYIARMLNAIVGVEITIDRLEGKWKMSQNRNEADRRGTHEGLRAADDDNAQAMADFMDAD